jgi:RNA polymerase sigma factor for flagellar operon FliA
MGRVERRRAELIEEHLPLVEHVVRRVASSFPGYVDRGELLSAGRLGLTEAAARFDFGLKVPFAPYAARRIRGAVLDHLRNHDWVPRSVRELSRRADRESARMAAEDGSTPDETRLAERLAIDPARLRDARGISTRGMVGSLDGAGRGDADSENRPHDRLADRTIPTAEEVLENRELHGYLRAALDSLPERLRLIIVGHYLEGRTLDQIAITLGLTPSRISQLRSDAIEMLRHGIEAQFAPEPETPVRPKGRVAIRQAQFAASIARHADWRTRLDQQRAGLRPPVAAEVDHSA